MQQAFAYFNIKYLKEEEGEEEEEEEVEGWKKCFI